MSEGHKVYEILLLDDDEDDYILLKSCLQGAFGDVVGLDWYQKDGISNELICSGLYAATLVDYRLGIENGIHVIQKAKAECPESVIFLFTGWPKAETLEEAAQAGADGIIKKTELSIQLIKTSLLPFLPKLQEK